LSNEGTFIDPLALHYLNIVRDAKRMGFEVQIINIVGDEATVKVVNAMRPTLHTLTFRLRNHGWVLVN